VSRNKNSRAVNDGHISAWSAQSPKKRASSFGFGSGRRGKNVTNYHNPLRDAIDLRVAIATGCNNNNKKYLDRIDLSRRLPPQPIRDRTVRILVINV